MLRRRLGRCQESYDFPYALYDFPYFIRFSVLRVQPLRLVLARPCLIYPHGKAKTISRLGSEGKTE